MSNLGTRIETCRLNRSGPQSIEVLVARYEKRIAKLEKQVEALSGRNVKPAPRNFSVPPSTQRTTHDRDRVPSR